VGIVPSVLGTSEEDAVMKVKSREGEHFHCDICKSRIWGKAVVENEGTPKEPLYKHYHIDCLLNKPPYAQLQQ